MAKKSKQTEEEKVKKTIKELKGEKELELKWEKIQPGLLKQEERAFTPGEKEKRRKTEKQPLISLNQLRKRPWEALNITRKQWNELKEPTKKELWKELHQRLGKQIQRGVKKRINKPMEEAKIEDVEKILKDIIGEDVSERTVLKSAQKLGIEQAATKLWEKGKEKYIETALKKGAIEPKEVKEAINGEGGNISMETAKDISKRVKVSRDTFNEKEIEEVTEKLKKGKRKQEIEQEPTVDQQILLKAAERYTETLKGAIEEEQKIRKILKEERGFNKEEIQEIMS